MGISTIEVGLRWFGQHAQFLSVVAGLATFGAYVVRAPEDGSIRERILPGLIVGLAAGHIPAAILLMLAGLDPEYLSYLRHQRIQVGLGGAVIGAFVLDRIIDGFKKN